MWIRCIDEMWIEYPEICYRPHSRRIGATVQTPTHFGLLTRNPQQHDPQNIDLQKCGLNLKTYHD
jgi:hypothetical protein